MIYYNLFQVTYISRFKKALRRQEHTRIQIVSYPVSPCVTPGQLYAGKKNLPYFGNEEYLSNQQGAYVPVSFFCLIQILTHSLLHI